MAEETTQDYWEDIDKGHVDTREANFKCEHPDESLGCDLGIDVMGQKKQIRSYWEDDNEQ